MKKNDAGAAAVELALVLPLLLLIVFGIVDFGRAYNAQITLSHAARESVRVWALGGTEDEARFRAQEAAATLPGINITTTACTFGAATAVNVTAPFTYLMPFIADGTTSLSAEGVMRCGG